ncbi:methylated-DNA--[protein]-cysteine S-methyltransferase [Halogeometricum limi]|uniref:methylated-DNA--[protein]-cysteine S-methyltransferase n=1 Tax=Halogeometricum limi TaxID=555875 RepID=A0A1I6GML5_9EURY|nr:methylated-DNA--[protein]-cysteine S-methyltransferase [Halogeometricum limi]SFR43472.1 methylated-DNA-[protein]-cysteine S-methyltransferase [Halogeometricum limi]
MRVEIHGTGLDLDESYLDADASEIAEQIREYERGDRRTFDLSVAYPDSFTGEVMRAMSEIPYGETRTYGELAAELDTSPVAVGQACGRNPVPLIVPCHRVVGSDGGLVGFSGDGGVDQKRRLLEGESAATQARLGAFE